MPYCPNCRSEIEADAAFCGDCGARIDPVPQPTPDGQQPASAGISRSAIIAGAAFAAAVVVVIVILVALGGDDDDTNNNGDGAAATATSTSEEPTESPPTEPPATEPPPTPVPPTATPPPPTVEPTVPVPAGYATPEEAIGAFLAEYNIEYAGDCSTTNVDTDIGKYCSAIYRDDFDTRVYMAGPAFSEFDRWLLVSRLGGGDDWTVVDFADIVVGEGEAVPPW